MDIVTLTGASGAGKTTLAGELIRLRNELKINRPELFRLIVSQTTRRPRLEGPRKDLPGEYNCISVADFQHLERMDMFLWTVFVHGEFYGTLRESVDEAIKSIYTPVAMLIIEAAEVLWNYSNGKMMPIFIERPESLIEQSLLDKESPEFIAKRKAECRDWLKRSQNSSVPFNYIQNDGTILKLVQKFLQQLRG